MDISDLSRNNPINKKTRDEKHKYKEYLQLWPEIQVTKITPFIECIIPYYRNNHLKLINGNNWSHADSLFGSPTTKASARGRRPERSGRTSPKHVVK